MKIVPVVSAGSRGNSLDALAEAFVLMFRASGYDAQLFNLNVPDDSTRLTSLLTSGNIAFVLGMAGLLSDLKLTRDDGTKAPAWAMLRIPHLSMLGDSPAYFFDRHVADSPANALVYGFPDHLLLRKRLPFADKTVLSVMPLAPLFTVPFESLDFAKKREGKLLFLKNGNDPEALRRNWRATLAPGVSNALMDLSELLTSTDAIDQCHGTQIDDAITEYYAAAGIEVQAIPKLRLLMNANLDDYARRIKSTMIARTLMDFPVVVHGENWDYLDFSGKRCTFISGSDYRASNQATRDALGLIDMSPNTTHAIHDRVTRAFGAYTYCLTNEHAFLDSLLPEQVGHMTFRFNPDSIAERVDRALANPMQTLEVGVAAAEIFRERFTDENFVNFITLIADSVYQNIGNRPNNLQEFIVWPPATLAH
ncbi:putative DUF3880 domain-containing protein [Pararobbsia alpina]|uniref:glycosyltransferase family protein n=1 Tax=Pararobbsia alpina TaxID=621374 RepID=UPI0039A75803